MNKPEIKTIKTIYPQIYAYILPTVKENNGWIKIGYTEKENVDERIIQQTKTAAINLDYIKIWEGSSKFKNSDEWFKDHEFHRYLTTYKKIERRPKTEWFYYNGNPEKSLEDFNDFKNRKYSQSALHLNYQLRTEQQAAIDKTLRYINSNENGEFLWNAKPRFGKTLTTYDLARKIDARNILIVTNRPAIANSWYDDFEKFIAWQTNYAFVSTSDSLKERPVLNRKEFFSQIPNGGKDRMIAFISLQDLKGAISFGGSHDKLKWVKDLEWDMLVIDEAHEGVDTLKTDIAFNQITRNFTLHLSGTPFKAIESGRFKDNQIYNWSYVDEQEAKINWDNNEKNNPYEKLPKLNMYSYQMSAMIIDEVNKGANLDGENVDYAFDLNEFFATKDNGDFIHEKDIKKWLNTLTHHEKYPFSTPGLRNELKHTFWILNRVDSAEALKKLLEKDPVFESYEIVLAAGDGRTSDDFTSNEKSLDRVKKAIKNNDKTITLSVGQLTTGVTIPEWTAVLMLSNIKSPALYMQAAFRSQNPWVYEKNDEIKQKENAYVFDFSPERTLIIYDEFANNLNSNTAGGLGTSDEREKNIKKLLNFFPVISEDDEGKMVKLNVDQVLTIPNSIKSHEVVSRGFMSNLLFQNISRIFSNPEVKEILDNLDNVKQGQKKPSNDNKKLELNKVSLDESGNILIDNDQAEKITNAKFGEKIYQILEDDFSNNIENNKSSLSKIAEKLFKEMTIDPVKELVKENGIPVTSANSIVSDTSKKLAREIEIIEENKNIRIRENNAELEMKLKETQPNYESINKVKQLFKQREDEIHKHFEKEVYSTLKNKSKELHVDATKQVFEKVEQKKKATTEEDVRGRLRGFARTIPTYLMAYGSIDTELSNFEEIVDESTFKRLTSITKEQFRVLRDKYQFFDEVVFNESIKEFLNLKEKLANYFDETQTEDIFDYIPQQETYLVYTPKDVVIKMIDELQGQYPEDFKDPSKTFADLYMKSGLFITELVKRLYVSLKEAIPNDELRLKHILENQVYGLAPTETIYNIAKNYIFGFNEKAKEYDDSHIVYLDTTPYTEGKTDISLEEKLDEIFGGEKYEI